MLPDIDPWLMSRRLQVGSRLRSLRESRNLRQAHLGERASLSRDTIWRIENGTRAVDSDQAHLIARALGVPVAWLFSDDWEWPPGGGAEGGEWADWPKPVRYP